jgi:hypothetical protein
MTAQETLEKFSLVVWRTGVWLRRSGLSVSSLFGFIFCVLLALDIANSAVFASVRICECSSDKLQWPTPQVIRQPSCPPESYRLQCLLRDRKLW